MELQTTQRIGSLIGLRSEYEKRYIILHKHTFPGVLKRIYDSNIRNYSIFLRDGMLFSYFEYTGQDYAEDMQKIGEDTTTQEWWKLTDPMQEPLKTKKEGEWWTEMEEICFRSGTNDSDIPVQRFACVAEENSIQVKNLIFPQRVLSALHIHKLSLFHNEEYIYLYSEFLGTASPSEAENTSDRIDHLFSRISLGEQSIQWRNMQEVFHTD